MLKQRIGRLRAALPEGFEAALVTTPENRFYLLDFDSHDAGMLLLTPRGAGFIIDSRYIEAASATLNHVDLLLESDPMAQLKELLGGVGRLYVESGITVAGLGRLQSALPGVEVDAGGALTAALDGLRVIKDEEELARMQKAQDITDACFTHILPFIKEGAREIDLALEMEHFMRANGAEKVAFDTICVAGKNSSLPHGVPGGYRLQKGDLLTMDFGAKYKGYCADMTRTVAIGEPGEEQRKVYDMVLRAHLEAMAAVAAGKTGCEVDRVARDIIYGEGYEGYFGHGLGHAVGIDVHENPRFSPRDNTVIRAGMVMTVEPGCYLPGRFGVRIEDMVLVTQEGCASFARSDKQLIVL